MLCGHRISHMSGKMSCGGVYEYETGLQGHKKAFSVAHNLAFNSLVIETCIFEYVCTLKAVL